MPSQAFNLLSGTPIGSWQLREDLTTDHKGRQTATILRSSMVGKEVRSDEVHYWVEMEMESYKIKKNGSRKKDGDTAIIKALIPRSTFEQDPKNVLTNMRGFGVEVIIQNGDQDPMLISGTGAMADAMAKSMGVEIKFSYDEKGSETKSVPAGSIACTMFEGSGSVETKVMIRTFRVDSQTKVCLSEKVPFGTVHSETQMTTNGKPSSAISTLLKYGQSGAVSKITKTPQEMPSMSNIFNWGPSSSIHLFIRITEYIFTQ